MNLASKLFTLLLAIFVACPTIAQDWYRVNAHFGSNYNYEWSFPYAVDQFSHFSFSSDSKQVIAHRADEVDGVTTYVPFTVSTLDSMTFVNDLAEEEQTHNKYQTYTLNITTNGTVGVSSKEDYVDCYVSLDGKDGYNLYSGSGRIRGRGNSTWEWYDKKPYRIKLDNKHKILGLDKEKDWVLLANYRDVTDLMNAFMFEVADWMGMPYTNHTRFVELFLDGDYKGVYQLTEQVEQGSNRVNVADNGGILLTMDVDDGPDGGSASTSSFWSSVYTTPMCVKYPDNATTAQVDSVKALYTELENTIKSADYEALDKIMDMKSFMTMAMLQEYCENVELCAPRSVYLYKDADGKWAMGPFWDWDAGFDFDWSDMTTGHTYFGDYKELILGSDPSNRTGQYGSTPKFYTDMFKSSEYTQAYKDLWNSVKDSIFTRNWAEMEKYIAELNKGGYTRDTKRWPLTGTSSYGWGGGTKTFVVADEIAKMKTWLQNRTSYLNTIINAYPSTSTASKYGVKSTTVSNGAITVNVKMNAASNYSQSETIEVTTDMLAEALGLTSSEISAATVSLTSLNADGTTGRCTAGSPWGAWFNASGNVCNWGNNSHVFIEPVNSSLYSWNYGCYPDICVAGDTHTVYFQYTVKLNGQSSTVKVKVNFGVDTNPVDDGQEVTGGDEGGNTGGNDDTDDTKGDTSIKSYKNMTCVGSETITTEYDMSTVAAYSKQNISIDMNSILAKFPTGATLDDLVFMACSNLSTGELTDEKTSSNGYYMMFDGTTATYGSSECKIGCDTNKDRLQFAYTADTATPASGTKCTASVYLVYNDKYYYEFKMNITLK